MVSQYNTNNNDDVDDYDDDDSYNDNNLIKYIGYIGAIPFSVIVLYCNFVLIGAFISIFSNQLKAQQG